MSACSYHASKESVGACHNCGKLVCAACHREVDGKPYCYLCVEKLFPAGPPVVVTQPEEAVPAAAATATAVAEATKPQAATTGKVAGKPAGVNPLWWVAVALGGWIGGLLGWKFNRAKQPAVSKYMLYGGIGWSALQVFVAAIIVFSTVVAPAIGTRLQQSKTPPPESGLTATQPSGQTQTPSATTAQPAGSTAPKEETLEVKPPAPVAPSQPTYQTTALVTQTLQPSNTDQTVKYEDKVAVTVPGGALKQQDSVTISSVAGAPGWDYSERNDVGIYSISFTGSATFDKPLTLEFAYDPAQIESQTSGQPEFGASYLDSDGKTWIDMPASADQSRRKVVVSTPHASIWRWWWYGGSSKLFQYGKFDVRYWDTDFAASAWTQKEEDLMRALKNKRTADNITPEEKIQLSELIKKYNSLAQSSGGTQVKNPLADFQGCLDQGIYSTYSKYPKYAVDTGVSLERARVAYRDKLGKELNPDILVSEKTSPNTDTSAAPFATPVGEQTEQQWEKGKQLMAIIDPGEKASSQSGWIGHINVHTNASCGMTGLAVTMAHELFHAVQSMDHYALVRQPGAVFGLIIPESLWWYESTADYAAFKIVKGYDQPTNHSIDLDFFREDFFSDGNPDENHPYKVAYFFDFLAKQVISFSDLFGVVDSSYRTKLALDEYLKGKTPGKLGLYAMYHEWVKSVVFDESGPYKGSLQTEDRPLDMTMQLLAVNLGHGMTADYIGIKPSIDADSGKRTLVVDLRQIAPQVQPEYCWVDVCKLKNDMRTAGNLVVVGTWDKEKDNWPKPICQVDLNEGDALYILVTKFGGGPNTFDINVGDIPSLKVKGPDLPGGEMGTLGELYTFEAVSSGIPSSAKYTWTVDGDAQDTDRKSLGHRFWKGGGHTISVKASWSLLRSIESEKYVFNIGTPVLTVVSPLDAGEKGLAGTSYTFTLGPETKYIPGGAEYYWYVGSKEIEGEKSGASHKFEQPGNYQVKAKAEWPVPEGSPGSVTGSVTFNVAAGFQITADPNPGNAGAPTRFGISGEGIPATAGFTWDFGKQEGGISTGSSDVKASHTYSKPGTYQVTVKAVDKASKKSLGNASLEYTVVAQPYVKIEPRPSSAKIGDKINLSARLYNMPEDISMSPRYSWTVTREGTEIAWPTDEALSYTIDKPGQWSFRIIVRATDGDGRWIKGKQGKDWLEDTISLKVEDAPSVSITPPSDLSKGQGLPEKNYSFSVVPTNIPSDADYTWYVNGKQFAKGKKDKRPSIKTEKEPKDYVVKVTASWKVKNQQLQADAEFQFTTMTGFTLDNGLVIEGTGTCMMENPSQFANVFLKPVLSRVTITVANNKAAADQSISFNMQSDETTIPCTAKVNFAGTVVNGSISGTYSIDAVANYTSEGKSIPIDLKYWGKFTSTALPAKPAGESVTLTLTGPLRSHMLIEIIKGLGAAFAACAGSAGGSSSETTFVPPTDDNICSSYTAKVQFSCTQSTK